MNQGADYLPFTIFQLVLSYNHQIMTRKNNNLHKWYYLKKGGIQYGREEKKCDM